MRSIPTLGASTRWAIRPPGVLRAPVLTASRIGRSTTVSVLRRSELDTNGFLQAGSEGEPPPDFTEIDRQPINRTVMSLFRTRMVEALGEDSQLDGYDAIIDLTRKLNSKYTEPRKTQEATIQLLKALFPSWLPGLFAALLSKPFPEWSCRLNAWFTAAFSQWLMGPSTVNDVEVDGGKMAEKQGVLVKRCRYLEESGCAAICINSCKIPTQEFFDKHMGLPLTMTPNYDDFSCQFTFGLTPSPESEDEALKTPCFQQCPTKRRHTPACDGIVPNQPN